MRSAFLRQKCFKPCLGQTARGDLFADLVHRHRQAFPSSATEPFILFLRHHHHDRRSLPGDALRRSLREFEKATEPIPGFPGGNLLHEIDI